MIGTVIVDYGLGNVGSVANMLRKVGDTPIASRDPRVVSKATRVILPGVGAFDSCMTALESHAGLVESLREAALTSKPVLGICVGMQMLADGSEEGVLPGLGLVPGRVVGFPGTLGQAGITLPVPHMNWCVVDPARESPLLGPVDQQPQRFYFVHSYHFQCSNAANVLATAQYGVPFTAAVQHERVYGVQFHPEKSHAFGFEFFRRFISLS